MNYFTVKCAYKEKHGSECALEKEEGALHWMCALKHTDWSVLNFS